MTQRRSSSQFCLALDACSTQEPKKQALFETRLTPLFLQNPFSPTHYHHHPPTNPPIAAYLLSYYHPRNARLPSLLHLWNLESHPSTILGQL